ncbi:TPA: helix-turn-helix domain-containing protein [Acinetobacter baumannii]|uniref:AraC family transcriptional regulator n=1 Tax=Acinetobacter baumannii TaxID=470 RepID=UPI00070F8856|nr:AraC family transcriptional regulator [Acinetobacter baumannii]EJD6068802.1 AraC family transcriptional regulator ligand-binding domain-containing protein [Acinetobacter baumannii]EJD6283254.1 AraC family transcriptional regulator ligand-binding domain-containing protein [Acinetobacter baumannii]EJD6297504.1 AraC family transcriptional regulator ligand-binding domain-containing protein [Acinetobacter baumannii]EJD6531818.1 AraC family transcriptional regulator ligand-binding domain-containin
MKDPYGLSKASIPISYAHLLLEIMVDKGFLALEILKKSKISLTLLDRLDARITPIQWSKLAWESLVLSKDSGLGYEYGIKLRLTAHGPMGYALMSSPNLRQAIEVSTQFFNMRLKDYQIALLDEHEFSIIEIKETHPVVSNQPTQAETLRRFFYECLMIGVIQAGQFLREHDFSDIELSVDWSEPSYHKAYQHLLPTIHFNQPTNQIRYKKQLLDLPIKMADPIAFKQALAQCEAEQLRFSEQIKDICLTVKAELNLNPQVGYPTFDEIANRLNMSSRTLRRHLSQVGSSYLHLLEEVQQKEAENLLLNSDMEIQEIALYLGYIQPTNFTRAFKKWTGQTPITFRKNQ